MLEFTPENSPKQELRERLLIAVREKDGKHQACLIDSNTKEVIYTSELENSLEDAVNELYAEMTLRYAAKGETIQIKTKKLDGPEFEAIS